MKKHLKVLCQFFNARTYISELKESLIFVLISTLLIEAPAVSECSCCKATDCFETLIANVTLRQDIRDEANLQVGSPLTNH